MVFEVWMHSLWSNDSVYLIGVAQQYKVQVQVFAFGLFFPFFGISGNKIWPRCKFYLF